jgi:predicted MFS family arabinose efflux permease
MKDVSQARLWNSNYIKVWSGNFLLYFAFMLLAPLFPIYLSDTYAADKETIGIVLSGYTLAALFVRPFSGFLVDSLPRKAVLLVTFFFFFAFFAGYLIAGTLTAFAVFRTLHGIPFGAVTVSNSTVAIDVLPSSKRTEGIGYYGLSNNIATAISPTIALWIYHYYQSYDLLFIISLLCSLAGLIVDATIKIPKKAPAKDIKTISLDRFILLKGWSHGISIMCFALSYSVISTYIAIYGREKLGINEGTGAFFMLLAFGLALSRIIGGRSLRKGKIVENATAGALVSVLGYLMFAALHNKVGYYGAALIIGLGNGHMYPAFQNMFIGLASNNQRGTANSTILTAWDLGAGIGVLFGGIIAERFGYDSAFWMACLVDVFGVIWYFIHSRLYFIRNRLR